MLTPHGGGGIHSGSDSLKNQEPPSTCADTNNEPLTELAKWLFRQKVSAAREFAHLDYEAAKADFIARRESGQPVGTIVKAWRAVPPMPADVGTADESIWAKYARENPGLYKLAGDPLDDQADDLVVDCPHCGVSGARAGALCPTCGDFVPFQDEFPEDADEEDAE
jgi:hypothetical protein